MCFLRHARAAFPAILLFLASGQPLAAHRQPPAPPHLLDDNDHWWGGFGDWTQHGLNWPVGALAVYMGDLIAGGGFWIAGGVQALCVARWDGHEWHPLGGGLTGSPTVPGTQSHVEDLVEFRGDLIAAGWFQYCNGYVGGTRANNIARWDGTRWYVLGSGLNGYVYQLEVYNDNLIATGLFTEAGGAPINYIARWDGYDWHPMGLGLNGPADGFTIYQGDLIASGRITLAGGRPVSGIARWDGTDWYAIGNQEAETFTDVIVYRDTLVANIYHYPGGYQRELISEWTGSTWIPIGAGLTACLGTVGELVTYNDHLYAGGLFTGPSGNLSNIARWDGTAFVPLGSGVSSDVLDGAVRDFVAHDGGLYVCGRFQTAGNKPSWHIARWDDVITPVSVADFAGWTADGAIQLTWRLSSAGLRELRSVVVQRALSREGPFLDCTPGLLAPEPTMSFTDRVGDESPSYWYRLCLLLKDGQTQFAGPLFVQVQSTAAMTVLYTPFVPSDGSPIPIRYRIGAATGLVSLDVFSVDGRQLRRLDRAAAVPGEHLTSWDRRNDAGEAVGRGVYLVRLAVDGHSAARKAVLRSR